MTTLRSQSASEQALDVLVFMKRNVQHLSMTSDLLAQDLAQWNDLNAKERVRIFERQRRRFAVACPTLAAKDRVRDASESLRLAAIGT